MEKVVKRKSSKKPSAESKAQWTHVVNVIAGPFAGKEFVSQIRIITYEDASAPPLLRDMAWQLREGLREMGHEPEDGKTYHLVHWPKFGLAIAIYGKPGKDEEWHAALMEGFWRAADVALWPLHEEDDEGEEDLSRINSPFGGPYVH